MGKTFVCPICGHLHFTEGKPCYWLEDAPYVLKNKFWELNGRPKVEVPNLTDKVDEQ